MIVHNIEQNTDEWYALRAGMPTGSMASSLLTNTIETKKIGGEEVERYAPSKSMTTYAYVLAAEVMAGGPTESWGGNKYTDRGHELEPLAAAEYEFDYDVDLEPGGFITDDEMTYGVSCDYLCGTEGIVEIKSKIGKEHLHTIHTYSKAQKFPTAHYQQCQMQLFATQRKWCDLYLYHPNEKIPNLRVRTTPDQLFFDCLEQQISAVGVKRDEIVKSVLKAAK